MRTITISYASSIKTIVTIPKISFWLYDKSAASPIKVNNERYTSDSSMVRLMPFINIELKIFKGSYKQNEMQQIVRKQAAIATDDILSFKQMNKAIKNQEIENISKCMIHG